MNASIDCRLVDRWPTVLLEDKGIIIRDNGERDNREQETGLHGLCSWNDEFRFRKGFGNGVR